MADESRGDEDAAAFERIDPNRGHLARLSDALLETTLDATTRLADRVSAQRSIRAGAALGAMWSRLHLPRTRRVEEQLHAAFPDRSHSEIRSWKRGVFEHLGRSLAEAILLRTRHREPLLDEVQIDGLDRLEHAWDVSATGGVLIATAHYGNWELAGLSLARRGVPTSVIFRGRDQPVVDRALLAMRDAAGLDYEQIRIGRAGLGLVRALKSGRTVCVLLDQNARREDGVFVPFFGRPACVRTGPVRLAMRLGVPILPAFIRRTDALGGHRIQIDQAIRPAPDPHEEIEETAVLETLGRLTLAIEVAIREDPTQWIWTHRRWRTQPHEPQKVSYHG